MGEGLHVRVYVCARESVCLRERERLCECVCVCVCVHVAA